MHLYRSKYKESQSIYGGYTVKEMPPGVTPVDRSFPAAAGVTPVAPKLARSVAAQAPRSAAGPACVEHGEPPRPSGGSRLAAYADQAEPPRRTTPFMAAPVVSTQSAAMFDDDDDEDTDDEPSLFQERATAGVFPRAALYQPVQVKSRTHGHLGA
jgi:hypothetical protein